MNGSGQTFPNSAHKSLLINGLKALDNVLPTIEAAEACGLDCMEYRQGEAELRARIMSYLAQFFGSEVIPHAPEGIPIPSGQ